MMHTASLAFDGDQHIGVEGYLCASTANTMLAEGIACLDSVTAVSLTFDLSKVIHSDSTGLALLFHWLRYAAQLQKTLHFTHLPSQMLAIAQVAGVEELLPVERDTASKD